MSAAKRQQVRESYECYLYPLQIGGQSVHQLTDLLGVPPFSSNFQGPADLGDTIESIAASRPLHGVPGPLDGFVVTYIELSKYCLRILRSPFQESRYQFLEFGMSSCQNLWKFPSKANGRSVCRSRHLVHVATL